MSKKDINSLTSDQLFELAKQRELEEQEQMKEAARAQIAALRDERKKMLARHKKELAALEAQLQELSGRRRRGAGKKGAQTGISDAVLQLLTKGKKTTTKDLREQLEAQGLSTANLAQTLAYLKRTGRVKSAARGTYSAA